MDIAQGRRTLESWGDGENLIIAICEYGFDEESKYGKLAIDFDYKIIKPYPNFINNGMGAHGMLTLTTHRMLLPEAEIHLLPPSGTILYDYCMKVKPHVVCASLKAINGLSAKQERDLLDQGIYLVVSAGNSGSEGESSFAVKHHMWTAVGAVRERLNGELVIEPYSAFGKGAVDFVGYAGMKIPMLPKPIIFSGTSQSAPYFADQVALYSGQFENQHGRRPFKSEVDNFFKLISIDIGKFDKDLKSGYGLPVLPSIVPELREGDLIELKLGEKEFTINGITNYFDGEPFIDNSIGRTMVELNGISMALGVSIGYDPEKNIIWIRR